MRNTLSTLLATLITTAIAAPAGLWAQQAQYTDWSAPANLGSTVNSSSNDQHPAISADNLSLCFVSDRPGGSGGFDLWVTERADRHSPWGTPQNLGPTVNTSAREFAPNLSRGGHYLFLGSDRPGGCGDSDLWVSHRKHLKDNFGWETPVNLGCVINGTELDDGRCFSRTRKL